jgi:hypothetical protein
MLDLEFFFSYNTKRGININISSIPVFQGIDSLYLQSFLAVDLGCDVFPSRVRNLKKANLYALVRSRKEDDNEIIIFGNVMELLFNNYWRNKKVNNNTEDYNKIKSTTKMQFMNAINIYVESFMCKPANYASIDSNTDNKSLYLSGRKTIRLHMYNKEFSRGVGSIVFEGLPSDCLQCVGPGIGQHLFLSIKGHCICRDCYKTYCYYGSFTSMRKQQ